MCFCDGYSFLVINKNSGEKHFMQGDETLCEFFEGYYSLPCLSIYHTTLTRNVSESKWNLSKNWGLKTSNFGNVLKNIYTY